jgi:hypothetical protein
MLKPLKEFLVSVEDAGSLTHHLDCGVDRLCQGLRRLGEFGERTLVVISRHFIKSVADYANDGGDSAHISRETVQNELGAYLSAAALEGVIRAHIGANHVTNADIYAHGLMYAVFQAAGGTIDCVPATVQSVVKDHPVRMEDEWQVRLKAWRESEEGQTWRLEKVGVDEVTREVAEKIIAKAVSLQWDCVMQHLEEWKESDCGQSWLADAGGDKHAIIESAIEDDDYQITEAFVNYLEAWKCDEGEEYVRETVENDPDEYKETFFENVADSELFTALGEKQGWC